MVGPRSRGTSRQLFFPYVRRRCSASSGPGWPALASSQAAMSVTSRLEAEERMLAESHSAGSGVWNDPVHCHPHTFEARNQCSQAAWQFSHR